MNRPGHAPRLHAIPLPPGRLIGRSSETAAIRGLLARDEVRLLTLTGPPGTGKTRLAMEMGSMSLPGTPDGVVWVDLAPVADPSLVASAIAQPLGVREGARRSTVDSLKDFLCDRNIVLLLDNFEQVIPAGVVLAELLAACPKLRIVVTSRAALRLRWEHEFPVAPLALPDLAHLPQPIDLAEIPAVALFLERAGAVLPDFTLSESNADAVARICVQLDGLPLCIELAAAHSKLFDPESMLPRLESRLGLLSSGARDMPERHQTLRGAISWSYSLLSEDERVLFRRLGVFTGGWTIEAAESVCGPLETDIVTGLSTLVENNLVRREPVPGESPRFRMLGTVREYAREALAGSGERESLNDRHARYRCALMGEAETGLTGADQPDWLGRIEAEYDNLRAALSWSIESGDAAAAVGLISALWRFWWLRAYLSEGRHRAGAVVAMPELKQPGKLRGQALLVGGILAVWQADYPAAQALLSEAERVSRSAGDEQSFRFAQVFLGRTARDQGAWETARNIGAQAVEGFRALGDTWGLALAIHFLGLACAEYDPGTARSLFEESDRLFAGLGARWDRAMPLRGLGLLAFTAGDHAKARTFFEESVSLFRERGDEWSVAMVLHDLGCAALSHGEARQAAAMFSESLRSWQRLANARGIALCLAGLATAASKAGLTTRAIRLFAAASAVTESTGIVLEPTDGAASDGVIAAARERVNELEFQRAWAEGRSMGIERAVEDALALAVSRSLAEPSRNGRPGDLTSREREVVALLATGASNRQIAAALVITEGTANLHVKHILAKLDMPSRAQVAAWAAGQRQP